MLVYSGCALSYPASLQAPQAHHSNNLKQMIRIKHNKLKILTVRRQTSWLFTKRGGVEFGTTETDPASGREEYLNLGPPDYKSSALPTRPLHLQTCEMKLPALLSTRQLLAFLMACSMQLLNISKLLTFHLSKQFGVKM